MTSGTSGTSGTHRTAAVSDADRLAQYVAAWASSVEATVALLRSLDDEDWDRSTDLAGWDVRAVAAHLAHLESELAGNEQQPVEVPELAHITSPMGYYTEMGPIARRAWPTGKIVDELEASAATRLAELRESPPADGSGAPPRTPGGIGWDWATLLSNRAVDVWMHEQDVRRAVGRPGGMDSPGAEHTVSVFARAFGYTVGKRVQPAPGTTVVLDVTGLRPVHLAVEVDENGRAVASTTTTEQADLALRMDLETYVILAGGRRAPEDVTVAVSGDRDLGARILAAMAVTP